MGRKGRDTAKETIKRSVVYPAALLLAINGGTIVLNSRSELYDTFIDCAERLSSEQRFGVLRSVRKRFGKG